MTIQLKVAMLIAAGFVIIVGGLLFSTGRDDAAEPGATDPSKNANSAPDPRLVRSDSHVLGERGASDVVLVEFLDFECEACRAAHPIVEDLRNEYAGEVTFVTRYFPLPGHFNSKRAAQAVESAARQGKYEQMYQRMFETQSAWGEQQKPMDALFRKYAAELGLDMNRFDADYASKEVADRVQRDIDDGTELGVQGTPTFYLDGELFQPTTVEDFSTALDAALGK